MRLRIHRGAAEIGGNCIKVEAQGKSILLDLGMPLSGNLTPSAVLPPVPGLSVGSLCGLRLPILQQDIEQLVQLRMAIAM